MSNFGTNPQIPQQLMQLMMQQQRPGMNGQPQGMGAQGQNPYMRPNAQQQQGAQQFTNGLLNPSSQATGVMGQAPITPPSTMVAPAVPLMGGATTSPIMQQGLQQPQTVSSPNTGDVLKSLFTNPGQAGAQIGSALGAGGGSGASASGAGKGAGGAPAASVRVPF